MVNPFSFSSPSLQSLLGGAALGALLLFRLVVSSQLALSIYHRVLLAFLSAVHGFLPSLCGGSLAFSSSSTAFASLRGPGELFSGLSLFCAFGLPLFGSLPSCPVPQVSLPPGGCLLPWVSASAMYVLASSSGAHSLGLCALLSVSGLASPGLSWFCFSFSILGWSTVCLSFSCVSSGPSRWGHPCQGRVSVVCSSTRSERRLSLSVSFVFLRDGVTLWVKCVLHTLLIAIEGFPLAVYSCSFWFGSPAGCCCLRLVFPWLCIIVCLCATLLFPVWLLSLGIHSSLRCVVPLATGSSSCLTLLFRLVSPLSLSSSRVPPYGLRVVLRSLHGPLFSLWLLLPCRFSPGRSFPRVSGFSSSCLGLPGCLPRVFFSGSVASLSSFSGSLALSGSPVCPLPRSFSVRSLEAFVCRLRAVLLLSLVPVSRFISLVLPLSLRVLALSLCLLALLLVLFLEPLFLAVSFLLLPRLPLRLFLPLLCLLNRGLLVCLLLRLRRRLRVLLLCHLFWLLPLGLPSFFHLLLSFCCAVLLLAWFS